MVLLQLALSCHVQKFESVTITTAMLRSSRRKSENPFSLPVLSLHIADPSASLVGVVVLLALPDLVSLPSCLLHDNGHH